MINTLSVEKGAPYDAEQPTLPKMEVDSEESVKKDDLTASEMEELDYISFMDESETGLPDDSCILAMSEPDETEEFMNRIKDKKTKVEFYLTNKKYLNDVEGDNSAYVRELRNINCSDPDAVSKAAEVVASHFACVQSFDDVNKIVNSVLGKRLPYFRVENIPSIEAVVRIRIFGHSVDLGSGTGFLLKVDDKLYLISNRHVLKKIVNFKYVSHYILDINFCHGINENKKLQCHSITVNRNEDDYFQHNRGIDIDMARLEIKEDNDAYSTLLKYAYESPKWLDASKLLDAFCQTNFDLYDLRLRRGVEPKELFFMIGHPYGCARRMSFITMSKDLTYFTRENNQTNQKLYEEGSIPYTDVISSGKHYIPSFPANSGSLVIRATVFTYGKMVYRFVGIHARNDRETGQGVFFSMAELYNSLEIKGIGIWDPVLHRKKEEVSSEDFKNDTIKGLKKDTIDGYAAAVEEYIPYVVLLFFVVIVSILVSPMSGGNSGSM